MTDLVRTALYRVRGDARLLLYIGISKDFGRRWKQHARLQPWWSEKRSLSVDCWYDSRPEAEVAEATAIYAERPKYNERHGTFSVQLRSDRPVEELTRAERTATASIMRLRISSPALSRIAESRQCSSCGAGPGELCRTASGRLAYYHQGRIEGLRTRALASHLMPAEPDLVGM